VSRPYTISLLIISFVISLSLSLKAQSISRKPTLVEQVNCIKESKGGNDLQGGNSDSFLGPGLMKDIFGASMPKDFGTISAMTDIYTKSPKGEEALAEIVNTARAYGGYVDVERTKKEAPLNFGPQDPNQAPFKSNSEININVSEGRYYDGEGGEERFAEDLNSACAMTSKALGIDATASCAKARKEQLEDLKKAFEDPINRGFVQKLASAPIEGWNTLIKEEYEKIKKEGQPRCSLNDEQRGRALNTIRNAVTNTSLCFAISPILPEDDLIFKGGKSYNSNGREIGTSVTINTSGKDEVYAAPFVGLVDGKRYVINPVYFQVFGGSSEEWKRIIGNSPRFGPGPITTPS